MKDKNLVHYFEVSDVLNQFVAAFDSIVIGRYRGRDLKNPVPVRFTYAPKQATLHALNNKAEHITVPVISVSISGIARDAERVQKKNTGHFINRITETDRIPAPVPVNISVNMSILTKTQEDMDQILANFIPYSNPYIILSWKIPSEFTSEEIELRSEVLWDENISITQPIERNESDRFRTVADTTFTIKAWLFKRHDDNPMGNIFEIDADFYPIKELGEVLSDLDVVDQLGLSAYPDFSFQQEVRHVIGTTPTQKIRKELTFHTQIQYTYQLIHQLYSMIH